MSDVAEQPRTVQDVDRYEVLILSERCARLRAELALADSQLAGTRARLDAKYALRPGDTVDMGTGAITRVPAPTPPPDAPTE